MSGSGEPVESEVGTRKSFEEPAYATDEKTKPGYVRAIVAARGLKTNSQVTIKGIKKKASNAEVTATFDEQSFCVTVEGKKADKLNYRLHIKKLPREINPDKSYVEPDKDRILVFLNKKEDISWYPELEDGLETSEEMEEES